jgi:hypothetical protein
MTKTTTDAVLAWLMEIEDEYRPSGDTIHAILLALVERRQRELAEEEDR